MKTDRAKNVAAFVVLTTSTVLGFHSLWGVLFLYWTIRSVKTKYAFLLSEVCQLEDPLLFWLIQIAWIAFGLLMIAADFLPGWS